MPRASPDSSIDAAVNKAICRLVPFLLLMYVLAFLDRVNIGFIKHSYQVDTGLSDAAYAFGAGVFFVGYALLEIPSNLILHRVGARIWMGRIMVSWGLISAASMFAHSDHAFYVLRLLLGVAEAGFFPGVIFFLGKWFPAAARGRVIGLFYFGAPLAFILGGPLSGCLLQFNPTPTIRDWQWLFLVEGTLAVIVGIWAFWYLDDSPRQASWLSTKERAALAAALADEEAYKESHGPRSVLGALTDHRVLFFALIYFLIQMSVYGVVFYLPTRVAALVGKAIGWQVGLVTAAPWLCALAAAHWLPRLAERTGQHAAIAALTLFVCAVGIALSATAGLPLLALIALCFAAGGFIGVQPLFWSFPTNYLTGTAAASGIALINSFGALGGFVAPNMKTWIEQALASPRAGSFLLASTAAVGAVLFMGLRSPLPLSPPVRDPARTDC